MKNSIPTYKEFMLKESMFQYFEDIEESDVEKIIENFEESLDYEDFKTVVESALDEDVYKSIEEKLENAFDYLNEGAMPDWALPSGDYSNRGWLNGNFKEYETGKQNYTDFPFGTVVKVTNEDLESYGVIAKVKSLEGLYFRLETENGVTYECKPEDMEIYKGEGAEENKSFNEGLKPIGVRGKDKFKAPHKDPVPRSIPEIIKNFKEGVRFQNKKGEVFKIRSVESKKVIFVMLDMKGNDTDHERGFGDKTLAQLFKNREFFFTDKHRRV